MDQLWEEKERKKREIVTDGRWKASQPARQARRKCIESYPMRDERAEFGQGAAGMHICHYLDIASEYAVTRCFRLLASPVVI